MRVYIGYDSREDIAYQVARYSVLKHSPNSSVTPIIMDELRANGVYTRGKDILASTAFATTRYLVPYMTGYFGWALYMDCDMLCTWDVGELMGIVGELINIDAGGECYAYKDIPIWCVQHNFQPSSDIKMDGRRQVSYPRKGWASLMLLNCEHAACKRLTVDIVNNAPIPYLNELRWCDDFQIGALPYEWNHLVRHDKAPDEDAMTLTNPTAKTPRIIHWTYGGPWLEDQPDQDYDNLWRRYRDEMLFGDSLIKEVKVNYP